MLGRPWARRPRLQLHWALLSIRILVLLRDLWIVPVSVWAGGGVIVLTLALVAHLDVNRGHVRARSFACGFLGGFAGQAFLVLPLRPFRELRARVLVPAHVVFMLPISFVVVLRLSF